jgi:hypothetical protein
MSRRCLPSRTLGLGFDRASLNLIRLAGFDDRLALPDQRKISRADEPLGRRALLGFDVLFLVNYLRLFIFQARAGFDNMWLL